MLRNRDSNLSYDTDVLVSVIILMDERGVDFIPSNKLSVFIWRDLPIDNKKKVDQAVNLLKSC